MEPDHVLIIDDDENDQYIAKYIFKKTWPMARISTANDGVEAIEILEASLDDLPTMIFLDINMPRMNGHEFLETWYGQRQLDIPVVIMLTSSEQTDDKARAEAFDCVKDYFVKPINKEVLNTLQWQDR